MYLLVDRSVNPEKGWAADLGGGRGHYLPSNENFSILTNFGDTKEYQIFEVPIAIYVSIKSTFSPNSFMESTL